MAAAMTEAPGFGPEGLFPARDLGGLEFYFTRNPGLEFDLGPLCTDDEWEARVFVALARHRRSEKVSGLLDKAAQSAEWRGAGACAELRAAAATAEQNFAGASESVEDEDGEAVEDEDGEADEGEGAEGPEADDGAWLADARRAEVEAWGPVVRAARAAADFAAEIAARDSAEDDMRRHARAAADLAVEIAARDSAEADEYLRQWREKQARGESNALFDLQVANLLRKVEVD
jgi:hypothetical protein